MKRYFRKLPASLTVEAAAVMGTTFLVIGSFLLLCLRIHDQAVAKNALAYSIEVYSRRDPEGENAEEYEAIAKDTGSYTLKGGEEIKLEKGSLEGNINGSVAMGGTTWTRENQHLRAPRWLRASTLADFKEVAREKLRENTKRKLNGSGKNSASEEKTQ